jgi:glycosyl transferase family 25
MKFYVINLDRRPDRLERTQAIATALGIAFERVPAVDAKAEGFTALAATLHRDGPTGLMSDNTLACTLSHFKAWETFLADPGAGEHAVILEDDVILSRRTLRVVEDLGQNRLWGYPLVKLEQGGAMRKGAFLGHREQTRDGYALRRAHQFLAASAAYMISRPCAAHLVGFRDSISAPIDHFLFYPIRRSGFWGGPYGVVDPAIAMQDPALDSDISTRRNLDKRWRQDLLRLVYEGRQAGLILPGLLRRRTEWVSVPFEP